ncbi:hypothetical protein BOW53_07660 [Solemya pervernicosa gill symbiont]|uniref:Uncharacterized protein n=2 Tax=Gammaproteobacteria incertae sedis TaxID=118884 RepID=A0A1T2L5W6_9GAMM|nr:hypothetical protein [Candidatus Reidiella endopervernicosa]OOZ40442.1 hypothetical protein BOW53_07660 [Solemya pervernicosa gill symbiont]QKQ28128.1 hypothetical protein HUE57_02915 [Candidatus Reidiella endopervernicosa]
MFSIFNKEPILDELRVAWLFDTYGWALRNFDGELFQNETILVTPSNEHFPGRVDSVHGMAELIFEQVKAFAGVKHWPTRLVDQYQCSTVEPPQLVIEGALRGPAGVTPTGISEEQYLTVLYDPNQINNPEGMIATYAHIIAHYLASMSPEPPPGGEDFWAQATEVLAVFMGFGLMFANSAYNFRGGCGSCYNANAQRSAHLSQDEVTYALAIFAELKQLSAKTVLSHLKKPLRSVFKRASREVAEKRPFLQQAIEQIAE